LEKCLKVFKNASRIIKNLELHGHSQALAKIAASQEFASLLSALKLELHGPSRALAKQAAPQGFASLLSTLII